MRLCQERVERSANGERECGAVLRKLDAMHSLLLAGVASFFAGVALFMGLVFSNGGLSKSKQFKVLAELVRGTHGAGARLGLAAAALLVLTGACLAFGGMAMSDAERANACAAACTARGHSRHRIGPNSDRVAGDARTMWVACICEGGGESVELRADGL